MVYFFDKIGKMLGYVNLGQIILCFDRLGNKIGKITQNGYVLFLYNSNNKLLAYYNGRNTYTANNIKICNGNCFYSILYPTLAKIKQ